MTDVAMFAVLFGWLLWISIRRPPNSDLATGALLLLIPLNALADSTAQFSEGAVTFGSIRALVALAIVGVCLKVQPRTAGGVLLVVLLWLTMFASVLTSRPVYTLTVWIRFALPLLALFAGYQVARRTSPQVVVRQLGAMMDISVVIISIQIIVANVMGLGERVYGVVYMGGALVQVTYYLAVYVVSMPLLWSETSSRMRKVTRGVLAVVSVFLILMVFRRGAVAAVVIGVGVLYLTAGSRVAKQLVLGLFAVALIYPFASSFVQERIALRGLDTRELEEEGRYREVGLALGDIAESGGLAQMFGKEMFNSSQYFEMQMLGRELHIDYLVLLHGSGAVGLSLYLLSYIALMYRIWIWRPGAPLYQRLRSCSIALIVCQLVLGLTGSLAIQTSRFVIMFILGVSVASLTARHYRNAVSPARRPTVVPV